MEYNVLPINFDSYKGYDPGNHPFLMEYKEVEFKEAFGIFEKGYKCKYLYIDFQNGSVESFSSPRYMNYNHDDSLNPEKSQNFKLIPCFCGMKFNE